MMASEKGLEQDRGSRGEGLESGDGGSRLESVHGTDKGSRLEMLDEASLTRQPEEVSCKAKLYTEISLFLPVLLNLIRLL